MPDAGWRWPDAGQRGFRCRSITENPYELHRVCADGRHHVSGFLPSGSRLPARPAARGADGAGGDGYGVLKPQCAMIAAVKGWHAGWAALLFCLQPGARAADDMNGAARELARKTVA